MEPHSVAGSQPQSTNDIMTIMKQVWSNASFHDPESLGDVLADAVDEGIGVVLCAYAARASGEASERGMALAGRLWQQYRPCTRGFVESGVELLLVPAQRTLEARPECAAVLEGTDGFSGGKESVHQARASTP